MLQRARHVQPAGAGQGRAHHQGDCPQHKVDPALVKVPRPGGRHKAGGRGRRLPCARRLAACRLAGGCVCPSLLLLRSRRALLVVL